MQPIPSTGSATITTVAAASSSSPAVVSSTPIEIKVNTSASSTLTSASSSSSTSGAEYVSMPNDPDYEIKSLKARIGFLEEWSKRREASFGQQGYDELNKLKAEYIQLMFAKIANSHQRH